ncbi:hypothetical protein FHETE_7698 [Fusarium heterosporum]|uniref:Uncharacterized protein n=1 Tax=Fusarium heterosporum TaxID=42747 RepID=A0A8H5WM81_FUSHE|nr:hypothetical protein FHETE_7698 [Fusarium heterosporum]
MESQISTPTTIAIRKSELNGDVTYRVPKHEPKHSSLRPQRSCLRPSKSNSIENTELAVAIREPPKVTKSVCIVDFAVAIETDGSGWYHDHVEPRNPDPKPRKSRSLSPRRRKPSNDTCSASPGSGTKSRFLLEDSLVTGRLRQAQNYCNANEIASIIRGSLDFLMAVYDSTNPRSERIANRLQNLGLRIIGSYVGEEREFVNREVCTFKVSEFLYRSKETSMSWKRRQRGNNVISKEEMIRRNSF